MNDACKESNLCHIPDISFLYQDRKFYGELYKGGYIGHDQLIQFKHISIDDVDFGDI